MRLLGGTFSATTHEEDVLALMKRANVVIFGRRTVYFRAACLEPIVPALQSPLAHELARLMLQAPTFDQEEEDEDDDVIAYEGAETSD